MKVIVISDMEGISGIARGEQCHGGSPMYEEGRKLYTEEMNAAVAGAKAAGAKEIVLMDHHGAGGDWSFNSLIPGDLERAGAEQALSNRKAVKPYDPGKPCEIKVEFKWTGPVAELEDRPGVEAVDSRTIVSRGDDWWTAWKQFYF